MTNNIMIDIETLGTSANSVVLSIGAVAFGEDSLGDEFYAAVNIDSCQELGLRIDGKTLAWWMERSDAARQVFSETGLPLPAVLHALTTSFDWAGKKVWCNGLSFDIPILDTAYWACKLRTPWAYYNTRDYRTKTKELEPAVLNSLRLEPTLAHNALADAKAQALTLMAVWRYERLGSVSQSVAA